MPQLGERRDRCVRIEQHVAPDGDESARRSGGFGRARFEPVKFHALTWGMKWSLTTALAVTVLGPLSSLFAPAAAHAQEWSSPRTLALVRHATGRREAQLADTGLRNYKAEARGYLTFLAQLGEGYREPPKIVRTDQIASDVYWQAPNLSKQLIKGRRDTLLLPTDINYHRDHLGIVQNNFPNIIRLGDGDEVEDVPHPLSPAGLAAYEYGLRDSLTIRLGPRSLAVYEVAVRPPE